NLSCLKARVLSVERQCGREPRQDQSICSTRKVVMPAEDRMRSLSEINHIFTPTAPLESAISDLLQTRTKLEVLEVGFGYGRVLLDLAWHSGNKNVPFQGVDVAQYKESCEDLRNIPTRFNFIPPPALVGFNLPRLYFYDATCLQFD